MSLGTEPRIEVSKPSPGNAGPVIVRLSGNWTVQTVTPIVRQLSQRLAEMQPNLQPDLQPNLQPNCLWDCLSIKKLDGACATILWRAWGHKLPAQVQLSDEHRRIFDRVAAAASREQLVVPPKPSFYWLQKIGESMLGFGRQLMDFLGLIGQVILVFGRLLRRPKEFPMKEISANLYKSGVRAMPVSALVGFLIGIVLSYLSALQLRQFGADVFIVDILGMGIIRELGPVLIAVLVAGRSGSAMTAQLGVMRVTEEIDALATMGIPQSLRLIFPKVMAMAVAMPLLVLWITVIAMAGGMMAAEVQLDIGYQIFFERLPKAVPVANLWIALCKGLFFGISIALVACHFGLRVKPNTESLSANTTASVVTSITVVILVDAIFAMMTRSIGVP